MPREPFHRLFFAVRPPAEAIAEIAPLRDAFGQTRGLVPDDQLHLTTWLFPDSQDFPSDGVARAEQALRDMPRDPFRILLERMIAGPHHVALVPGEPLPGFTAFQARLDHALRGAGLLPRADWRFRPHLTLLHSRYEVDQAIEPIGWPAAEILLIDSVVGERRHDVIARWALSQTPPDLPEDS